MKAKEKYRANEPLLKLWLNDLSKYNDGPFIYEYIPQQWTMGQLYDHVVYYTLELCIKSANTCLESKASSAKETKNFAGWYLFQFSRFPFWKLKADKEEVYQPINPENTAKAKDRMIRVIKEMSNLAALLEPKDKKSLKTKVKHPTLGYLNAWEWYNLVYLHLKHHLKQKQKLEALMMKRKQS